LEQGASQKQHVSEIKPEIQRRLPLLQSSVGFSWVIDTKLGIRLSNGFLSRDVLTLIQRECLRRIEQFEDPLREHKSGRTGENQIRVTDKVITAVVLRRTASSVAQTEGALTD
jgi:hypothetical protein